MIGTLVALLIWGLSWGLGWPVRMTVPGWGALLALIGGSALSWIGAVGVGSLREIVSVESIS